jgi:hypothetical protein
MIHKYAPSVSRLSDEVISEKAKEIILEMLNQDKDVFARPPESLHLLEMELTPHAFCVTTKSGNSTVIIHES